MSQQSGSPPRLSSLNTICSLEDCTQEITRDYQSGNRGESLVFVSGTTWKYAFATPETTDTFFKAISDAPTGEPTKVIKVLGATTAYSFNILRDSVSNIVAGTSFEFDTAINDADNCASILTNTSTVQPFSFTPSVDSIASVSVCEFNEVGELEVGIPVFDITNQPASVIEYSLDGDIPGTAIPTAGPNDTPTIGDTMEIIFPYRSIAIIAYRKDDAVSADPAYTINGLVVDFGTLNSMTEKISGDDKANFVTPVVISVGANTLMRAKVIV